MKLDKSSSSDDSSAKIHRSGLVFDGDMMLSLQLQLEALKNQSQLEVETRNPKSTISEKSDLTLVVLEFGSVVNRPTKRSLAKGTGENDTRAAKAEE